MIFTHIKSGKDYYVHKFCAKLQIRDKWTKAVIYHDKDMNYYCRTNKDFNKSFKIKVV